MSVAGNSLNGAVKADVVELDGHIHNRERWFGIAGSPSGTDWGEDTLNPYTAISGSSVYGADPNDEALVLGTADTPVIVGTTKFDPHQLLVTSLSVDTPFKIRIIYGTGTMADAITALQFTEVMVQNGVAGAFGNGSSTPILMPRCDSGSHQIWVQCKCASDNATCTFFVGIHEYVR